MDHDAIKCVRVLRVLLDRLPTHFDRYCYGTDTMKRLMGILP